MEKVDLATADIASENAAKLAELFPDIVTEVLDKDGNVCHSIDVEALKAHVGDIAEDKRERYQFTWPGKQKARAEAIRPIGKTMRPAPEESVNWDTTENLYIEGDNLDALKILRETYAGKIKMIYIDPPYNTGHEFVYNDSFACTAEEERVENGAFDERGNILDGFEENRTSKGRFHSDWCSMMYPRLLLAKDLLSDDGAIFISIDDHESRNLRLLSDEIFGVNCFVADIAWQKTYSPRNDSKGIPAEIEHILVYSKQGMWIPGRLERTADMDDRYASPDGDPRPWSSGDAAAPGAANHQGMVYAIQHPITGELLYPPNGRCRPFGGYSMLEIMNEWAEYEFRNIHDEEKRAEICGVAVEDVRKDVDAIMLKNPTEETFAAAQKRYEEGNWPRLYFTGGGKGGMRLKRYLDTMGGKMPTNLWPYSEVGHTDEAKKHLKLLFDDVAPFDTPKPVRLMKRILDIATDANCIVLDFFSGSASMAEGVMEKNSEDGGLRQFVLVQIPEKVSGQFGNLCEIGKERIRRAGAKIAAEVEEANAQLKLGEEPKKVPDIGFRVLKIDSSNFEDVKRTPDVIQQDQLSGLADNLKPDRTPEDILFQLFPQFVIPYTARIDKLDICGKTVYSVDDDTLLACFDREVPEDVIRAMAEREPLRAVLRDASFIGDDALANFEEIFKTISPATQTRVV
ncbi:site-specific DNA-methyltransferase [Collinsella provencensis]|uniref:site-specific DNA-methyltransferase n=1 Tax=Collinsella provencensis TaxID=1937461 RepID=UPI000C837BC8|nr:site-specific DNA-methyltransferase [Collinsella provencensis]